MHSKCIQIAGKCIKMHGKCLPLKNDERLHSSAFWTGFWEPVEFCSFACRCISVQGIHVHSCAFALHSCIKVHPRAFYVHSTCIRVHSCASACISCVHPCAFMCIHLHPRGCAFMCIHAHYMWIFCASTCIYTKNLTCRRVHLMCTCSRISVHSRALSRHLVYSCAFVSIYLHRNCVHSCASLCINSAFIAIHMTCLHVQSCPTWQELATRCNVSAAFNARTFDQAQRPARARAFLMHLTCIYAHLNHVKECIYIYNAGKCIVNVMRLRREARVCGGLIAFVHSTCNARECA